MDRKFYYVSGSKSQVHQNLTDILECFHFDKPQFLQGSNTEFIISCQQDIGYYYSSNAFIKSWSVAEALTIKCWV